MMLLETSSAWMKAEEVRLQKEDGGWISHAEVSTPTQLQLKVNLQTEKNI